MFDGKKRYVRIKRSFLGKEVPKNIKLTYDKISQKDQPQSWFSMFLEKKDGLYRKA